MYYKYIVNNIIYKCVTWCFVNLRTCNVSPAQSWTTYCSRCIIQSLPLSVQKLVKEDDTVELFRMLDTRLFC